MIRRRIAGMKRHDHIDLVDSIVIRNIPLQKSQFFISVFYCQFTTMADHLFFQIQPDDPNVVILKFMQIIVHCKCQIRLPASEIQDRHFPFLIQSRKNILDKFQKTVDLPELIKLCAHDFPILRHHAEILKKRNRDPLFQNVFLTPVMGKIRLLFPAFCLMFLDRHFPLFTHENRIFHVPRIKLHLPELFHIGQNPLRRLLRLQILMKRLCFRKGFQLVNPLSAHLHRAYFDLQNAVFFTRIAQDRLYKFFIQYVI